MDTKCCSRCGETKAVAEFHPHNAAKDGYRSSCKACYAEANKQRIQTDGQHKMCSTCGEIRPLSEFHKAASSKDGYRSNCKLCVAEAAGWSYRPKENLPEGQKRCTKCQNIYPATAEWFYSEKRQDGGNGLQSTCKSCWKDRVRNYAKVRTEQDPEYSKRRYAANREVELERSRRWYQNNKERHHAYVKKWKEENKGRVRELEKAQYEANREAVIEKARQWRKENYERYRAYNAEWIEQNPEKVAAIRKAQDTNRRARKRNLPNTFTPGQWRACLDYWGHQCAVCGEKQNFHADHWIPLVAENCPGTVVENMICLCANCNRTKNATLPAKWIAEKFDDELAKQKLAEIETYFEYVKSLKKESD